MVVEPRSPVRVESQIQLSADAPLRWDVDHEADTASIYIGERDEHVLRLCRESLHELMRTCVRALAEMQSNRKR